MGADSFALRALALLLLAGLAAPALAAPTRKGPQKRPPTVVPATAPDRKAAPPERRDDERRTPKGPDAADERELKRGERVEFDGRIIEGQTAAQGAIYLFERLPSELRSMVLERRTFRAEVLETLYPTATPPPQGAADRPAGAQNPAH